MAMDGSTGSPDSPTMLVDRWYVAWDQRDIPELLRVAHPEIEVIPENSLLPRLPGASFRGHSGLRTMAVWSYENYPHLRVETRLIQLVRGVLMATATFLVDETATPVVKRLTSTIFDMELSLIRRARIFQQGSEALREAQGELALTTREREVFQRLARGMTAPEIAAELFISPATVRTHVQNGVARLGAKTRVQAVSIAIARGEIET
jgi:DNA-binding CsgD family transcriptional regulator